MVTPDSVGRALMDVSRRSHGLPTREENLAALAEQELARRKALADAGLTEARAAALPRQQEMAEETHAAQMKNYASMADYRNREKIPTPPGVGSVGQYVEGLKTRLGRDLTPEELLQAQTDWDKASSSSSGGAGGMAISPYVATDDEGNLAVYDKKTGKAIPGMHPPPTSEMRNTEYQGQSLEPAFQMLQHSLDTLEETLGGDQVGWMDRAKGMVPSTQAYYAKDNFNRAARAFAGAILARMSGEGSRLSDEDRVAYSNAAAIVNDIILLPGGIQESRRRLNQALELLKGIQERRKRAAVGLPTEGVGMNNDGGVPETGKTSSELGSSEQEVIQISTPEDYAVLNPGQLYRDPNGVTRRKK